MGEPKKFGVRETERGSNIFRKKGRNLISQVEFSDRKRQNLGL